MINLEILITLVAMLVAFFMVVYMLQKGSSWKKRIKRDYETLELARQLQCDIGKPENLKALGLNPLLIKVEKPTTVKRQSRTAIVFSIIIFCSFLGWSYYLMTLQLTEPAVFTFVFAITCVLALLYAQSNIKASRGEREKLRDAISRYEHELAQPATKITIARAKVSLPEAGPDPLEVLYQLASGCDIVPEDSCLKRHFLSKVMADVAASFGPSPTDSTLKRHHDSMLKAAFVEHLQSLAADAEAQSAKSAIEAEPAVSTQATGQSLSIPEDSMLRRHFLSQLRREIEDRFGDRPTDSTLKRHYQAMVDTEFEARVQALSGIAQRSIRTLAVNVFRHNMATVSAAEEPPRPIPEDSTLRRHFLTELKAKMVSKLPPKPTDFNLLRHYNAMLDAALEKELKGHCQ